MGYHPTTPEAAAPAAAPTTKIQLDEKPATAIETGITTTTTTTANELEYGGYESVASHPFRSAFGALVILGVPISLFLYCGGYRWMRKAFRGKGKYRRVGDEDLEK